MMIWETPPTPEFDGDSGIVPALLIALLLVAVVSLYHGNYGLCLASIGGIAVLVIWMGGVE